MPSAKLTALHLRRLEPGRVYIDGAGLRLKVKQSGAGYWIFRYRRNGRDREMGLGPLRDVSLVKAREQARELRETLRTGGDPKAERARARARIVPSFRECAERLIEQKSVEWHNAKHAAQWTSTLANYAYPRLGDLPVDAIETEHVLRALEPIWRDKTETATRVRQRIEAVLDYAKARNLRRGENPARWRGHLDKLLAKPQKFHRVRHHPALAYRDMPEFMAELAEQSGAAARALEFTILMAARTQEALGARWCELEAENVWAVPARRMKARRAHRVPLSAQAQAILARMPQLFGTPYIFPGRTPKNPLSGTAMLMQLKRMGRDDVVVHGFRSTFRDWCAEQTNIAREVAEAALAHAVLGVEGAYQRGDLLERRRTLMQLWADYCLPDTETGVVSLHRKRADATA